MNGIQAPSQEQTEVPTIQSSGIFGALWAVLSSFGSGLLKLFGPVLLSTWHIFVNFLDTIFGWLGMPHGFSSFLSWISSGIAWLTTSFLYVITLLGAIFGFIIATVGGFLTAIAQALASFANVIVMIGSFLSGGVGGAGNLWNSLGLMQWFTVGLLFYPLYLVVLWDEKGMGAVMEQLGWIWGTVNWLAHFFLTVITTVFNLISGIIEAIPVVE